MPLQHVDPHKKHGWMYRAMVRFGRSRLGQLYARLIAARIEPYLYRFDSRGYLARLQIIATATLVTTGAKTRKLRKVQLAYFHDQNDPILIGSNFGGATHPQWTYNLIANPECVFGGDSFVAVEVTDPNEYERLYGLAEKVYTGYADYRVKTAHLGRRIPLFRLSLTAAQAEGDQTALRRPA